MAFYERKLFNKNTYGFRTIWWFANFRIESLRSKIKKPWLIQCLIMICWVNSVDSRNKFYLSTCYLSYIQLFICLHFYNVQVVVHLWQINRSKYEYLSNEIILEEQKYIEINFLLRSCWQSSITLNHTWFTMSKFYTHTMSTGCSIRIEHRTKKK